MSLIPAPDLELEERRRVAAAVTEAVRLAGLPAQVATGNERRNPGVNVEVDPFADDAGGVFVSWHPSAELVDRFAAPLLAHEFDHPAILLNASIANAMVEALRAILSACGFTVEVSDDEYRSSSLRVTSN